MPEMIEGLPYAEYSGKPGLHSTMVATRDRLSWLHAVTKKADTPEFSVGRAFHCAVLEPARFLDVYMPYPSTEGILTAKGQPAAEPTRTTEYKARVAKMREEHPEAELLEIADYAKVRAMAQATLTNHGAYLRDLKTEVSLIWDLNGVPCKARLDGICQEKRRIVELKSTFCAEPRVFTWDCKKWSYALQMAFQGIAVSHVLGWTPVEYIILACESAPPYGTSVHRISLAWIAELEAKIMDYVGEYQLIKDNVFPGYDRNNVNVIDFSEGE